MLEMSAFGMRHMQWSESECKSTNSNLAFIFEIQLANKKNTVSLHVVLITGYGHSYFRNGKATNCDRNSFI